MTHLLRFLLLMASWAAVDPARAAAADDAALLRLARGAGCMACHQVEQGGKGPDGQPLVGPPLRLVAARYRGDATAAERLTRAVLDGSDPARSHWKDQAAGLAMPANAVAMNEAEAKALVRWILALTPRP